MSFTPLTHRKLDALPSPYDHRDLRMRALPPMALPDAWALPVPPVLDQGQEGACVGHGCAGARESIAIREATASQPLVPLSRAYIYYRARLMEGTQNEDAGAYVRDGAKVLNREGVCGEVDFPYRAGDFRTAPSAANIAAAAAYTISAYYSLASVDQIRTALSSGQPVVIGFMVYQSFETVGKDGLVPMPKPGEQPLGGHCVFLYGYRPDPQRAGKFLIDGQNSWGTGWANGGRMSFQDDFLDDPRITSDRWALQGGGISPTPTTTTTPPPKPKPHPPHHR